ncbi:MAG: hypothetical protein COX17_04545 [Deltaproteobacteria bacterium CG23_combo_of_CG06-09_8_20_14_all_60_8]|nr:MAG: hypothetical protein COX17_04545 [Deltaproteobacteria bacterium CG23_combo_of_CG06-09_8_20_14_all_60_8]
MGFKKNNETVPRSLCRTGEQPMTGNRARIMEDELLMVRHSGEIPAVAFHGALHFLGVDPEGPGLVLTAAERLALAGQARQRFREILLRDLRPDNRDQPHYRGQARCAMNWERCSIFCQQQGLEVKALRQEVAVALISFLRQESDEIKAGLRPASLTCTSVTLGRLAAQLGLAEADLPAGWETRCADRDRPEGPYFP